MKFNKLGAICQQFNYKDWPLLTCIALKFFQDSMTNYVW